jgi:biopolymer transport protein ExbD
MNRLPQPRRARAIVEITPLSDVVFLLLIYFLLTSTSIQRSMDVDLPRVRSGLAAPATGVVVTLRADNSLLLDQAPLELDALVDALRQRLGERGEAPLTIEADRRASFDRFAQVLDRARLAGATQINLATGPATEPR